MIDDIEEEAARNQSPVSTPKIPELMKHNIIGSTEDHEEIKKKNALRLQEELTKLNLRKSVAKAASRAGGSRRGSRRGSEVSGRAMDELPTDRKRHN